MGELQSKILGGGNLHLKKKRDGDHSPLNIFA
jgi:hypothetical protein